MVTSYGAMTVMDDTCNKISMAILMGELKPREHLVESELVSKFKVKRFTIRKAIQELAYRGFVELTPNKGARVVDISDEELEDLYCVRMNLEILATELLIKRITPEKLRLIKKIHTKYIAAVEKGARDEMVLLNDYFHRTLYRMTDNRFLADHLERLNNSIFALRYNAYLLRGDFKESVDQHEAIIQALEDRDLDMLKSLTQKNVIYPKMIYDSRKMKHYNPMVGIESTDAPL
jgi:DNA-binding GntR family transcriptional regulator